MNNDEYVKIRDNIKLLFKGRRKSINIVAFVNLYKKRFISDSVSDINTITSAANVKIMILNLVSEGYLKLDEANWAISKNKKA